MSQVLTYELPEHLRARLSAERRDVGVQLGGIALAILCVVGASFLVPPANEIRKTHQLVIDPNSIKGLPPGLALLGKLGTFRALAIDWASIRAERLKNEGKFYEAYELHDTICKLAPRFPQIWANAAWNMAYNISVSQYSPEQRWRWVQNGIKLLRDKGIQYNPRSVALYRELAWIFWHKIGDFLDDEHLNYKRALAVEWEKVLGPVPVVTTDEEYFDWFRKIVDAPKDLEKLISSDQAVSDLVAKLQQVNLKPNHTLLEIIAKYIRPELQARNMLAKDTQITPKLAARLKLLENPDIAVPLDKLLSALRSKIIREEYKMKPAWMLDLMAEQYGPLDWRNAFSHTLYWASLGDQISKNYYGATKSDRVNTARLILFALQSTIMKGHIVLWPNFDDKFLSYLDLTPDIRFIPYLYDTYMRISYEQFPDDPNLALGKPADNYFNGFVSNMELWIQLLYYEGGEKNRDQAEAYMVWLRENNPHPNGSTQERYLTTLDEFVVGDLITQMNTYRSASGLVNTFIIRGFKHLGLGLTERGMNHFRLARYMHDYWNRGSKGFEAKDRSKMQPFGTMFRDQLIGFMKENGITALFKARLWRKLPLRPRQSVYDELLPFFQAICERQRPPWDPTIAFDEPASMSDYRKQKVNTLAPARREGVQEGAQFKN